MKISFKTITQWSAVMLTVGMLASCTDNFTNPSAPTGTSLTSVVSTTDSLKVYNAVLNKIGEAAAFNTVNSGQFTIFAPSNYAFVKYLRASFPSIPNVASYTTDSAVKYINNKVTYTSTPLNISTLITRLNYHVISTAVPSSKITGAQGFTTMNGARLSLSNVSGATYPFQINANVTSSGGGSGSNIIVKDLTAANGVVHVVDRVMAPISTTGLLSFFGMSIDYTRVSTDPKFITVPSSNTNYNILANALKVTQAITTLVPNSSPLPDYTVFAPDDASFLAYLQAAFPSAGITNEATAITFINSVNDSSTPTKAALTELLKYHVVAGRVLSTDIVAGTSVTTLSSGHTFSVDATTGKIQDAKSNLVPFGTKDNLTNAGVVHVISGVLQF